ncbi:hypothetical protein PENSUB_6374 [Penicillium subrubescens]|uniref:Uncharacterized protein n=1 Tax=Penicillium subrubescens TaxID=1316194 RepID=A0A1Q5U1S8_9EURO|nr:hypothetical protein PENSUB_6374 [Penicillium subrubescens]
MDRKIEALESKVKKLMTDQNTSDQSLQAPSEAVSRMRSTSVTESDDGDKDIIDRAFFAIQFHTTALSLYQLALAAVSPWSESQPVAYQLDWNEMLCAAMSASEYVLNSYLELPVGTELGFTNTQWVQMAFSMVILYRHTAKLSNPNQAAAFLSMLNQLQQRIGTLSTPHVDSNGDRDTFFDFTRRVVQIKGLLGGPRDNPSRDIGKDGSSIPNIGMHVSVDASNILEGDPLDLDSLVPEDLLMQVDFSSDYLFEASVEQIMGNWI